ncbi:MAG: DNA polymerase III subunit gamma/tau [Ferruginibacter sp.]|nr:DNA polymerase III subunit gamma/tau [Ferruginibacter sp.]
MEKFVVSARKYRPQNFSTVVGQQHITTTLKNAINNNQLAHAFLFCGPRGVGKTTCARILAKTINCETKTTDGEACNTCNSCISFDNGSSMNIHELDAASNNSVDDIRSLVEQVRFAPQAGDYKVYIVDEVHMLSASAFNAFLKTLEEPPPYAIFILATTEKHKILPTILSRCQIFDFKRITTDDTVTHLKEICEKEHTIAENAALHVIAQKSEGCMRDSLSILDKIVSFTGGKLTYANTLEHLNILDEDYFFKLLNFAIEQKLSDALLLFDEINQKGFEGDTLLEGLTEFLRNLLVSKDVKAAILLEVAEDFRDKYLQAANEISTNWIIAALNCIQDAAMNYKLARNKRLCVEMAIIKLCYLNQAIELLVNDAEGILKKKIIDTTKAVSFKTISFTKVKKTEKDEKIVVKEEPKASLVIKQPKAIESNIETAKVVETKSSGFGMLSKMRAKIIGENKNNQVVLPLTIENLQKAWATYTLQLESEKKHPTVTQFKAAQLSINDETNFTITTEGKVQQKFIENERSGLIHFLQSYFNNNFLKYNTQVLELESTDIETTTKLTSKQQYQLMLEKYPLIKELKERLKLELDY